MTKQDVEPIRQEFGGLRQEFHRFEMATKRDLKELEYRLVLKLGTIISVGMTLFVAALALILK